MTNIQPESNANAMDGTGAGIEEWFSWMIRTHEVAENTASGLRNGVRNVLQIDPEWNEVDLVRLDMDNQVQRFRIAKKGRLSDSSVDEYARRFRVSVDSYRRWLDGDKDWQPAKSRPAASTRKTATKRVSALVEEQQPAATTTLKAADTDNSGDETMQDGRRMLRHNIPLRSGAIAVVQIPVDLSPAEARRIGKVVASLAMDEDDDEDRATHLVRAIER